MNALKISILVLILALFYSCGKKDDSPMEQTPAVGKISGQVMHHEIPVPGATVYLKYDVTEFPGIDPSVYDRQVIATDSNAFYEFTELEAGSYYLFGSGFDADCPCDVIGGIPIYLDKDPSFIEINIPVTE